MEHADTDEALQGRIIEEGILRIALPAVSWRPKNFSFEIEQGTGCCPYWPKLPQYQSEQWGGRLDAALYERLSLDVARCHSTMFSNLLCALTLWGFCLLACCALRDSCLVNTRIDAVLEKYNAELAEQRTRLLLQVLLVNDCKGSDASSDSEKPPRLVRRIAAVFY